MQGVDAGYDRRIVVRGFDLAIPAGSVCALMGANGAGKSTVARLACGLVAPRRGRVTVGGLTPRRVHIGLAPQETALFPTLTPRENVRLIARLAGVPRGRRDEATARALALTGSQARADQPVRVLSGGWRRRANLAAALVGEPALIVADEPTEGVDAATRTVLSRALRAAVDAGAGCLLISHDPVFVAETADRVGVMAAGRLRLHGAPGDLLADAFGGNRVVSVRLPRPASPAEAALYAAAGLSGTADGLEWRGLSDDALALAHRLSPQIEAASGEVAVRPAGLADLAARIGEAAP